MEDKNVTKEKQRKVGNLIPYEKGVSGNPNGRPKESYSLTHTLKNMLADNPALRQNIVEKVTQMAQHGDIRAIQMLWSYMDGLPSQKTDITVTQVRPLLENLPEANVIQDNDSPQEAIEA